MSTDERQVVTVPHGTWTTLPNDVEVFHCSGYVVEVWWHADGSVGTVDYQLVRGFAVRIEDHVTQRIGEYTYEMDERR